MENFLANIYLKPDLIKEFLEKLTRSIIIWIEAQQKVLTSADGILLTDDISGLVSAEIYRKFFFPYHCRIREKFKDYVIVFHCDTKSDHILEFLPQIGVDVFNLGPTTSLVAAKEKIGRKVCLMGNMDPVNVMQNGEAESVKKSAEECLKVAMMGGGYLLSGGGGLNEDTPYGNIKAIVEIAKSKGTYQ